MRRCLRRRALPLTVALTAAAPGLLLGAVSKPAIHDLIAASTNYTYRSSRHIDMIVIHKAEGDNAAAYFQTPGIAASANYDVHHDGSDWLSVPDHDIAWHCGNWAYNERSIGIEQAGFTYRNDVPEVQYRAMAHLCAYLCSTYHIPADRHHIIGHDEVPDPFHPGQFGGADHHTDPGPYYRWSHLMALIRQELGSAPKPKPPAPKPAPTPAPPPPPPSDSAKLQGITGSLDINAGTMHLVTVAFRNTGQDTWEPATTVLAEDVTPRTSFQCPVSQETKPTQVGTFKFNLNIPAGTQPQSVVEKLGLFDNGKLVASGVVTLGIKVR